MNLDERIAKRKAEGWTLDHFVVKRSDESKFYYFSGTGFVRELGFAKPYISIETASYGQKDAVRFASETKVVPVWSRTIKRHRTYSFWQACKMAMAGKKMRKIGDNMPVMSAYCNEVRWDDGAAVRITGHNLDARWELAE